MSTGGDLVERKSMLVPALALALALGAPPRLAVLPIAAGDGVPPGTATAVAEALAGEIRRRAGLDVITQRDINALLTLERQKEMLGCQSDACMAELGGALGCDRLVAGDLAQVGESWLFSLKLVETARARVAAQSDRRLRGGTIDDVLDQVPGMVGELLPGAAPAPAPLASLPHATSPGTIHWALDPVEVPAADRDRLAAWADEAGHLIVTVPFAGMDAPFYWGDARRLFQMRLRGGGQEGKVAFDRLFWEPRARVPAEAMFEVRQGRGRLTCGHRAIPMRQVPPGELAGRLKDAHFFATRWRRLPQVLARDDAGTYYYVDVARGADGTARRERPEYELYVGRKGRLTRLELEDTLSDGGGQLFVSRAGRLEVKRPRGGAVEATWLTGSERKALTWLEADDHGPLIYSELGVYGTEPLGTPCDGRF
jgi:hypothetical protein